MPSIFLQEKLDPDEIAELKSEFPLYHFLESCGEADWPHVEVLYGNRLSEKEFEQATRLRWIHSPNTDIEGIPPTQDVLISLTKGHNVTQMAEFAIGAILGFAKQFFHWKEVIHDPQEFWQWPLRDTMWTLKGRTLLQIGLGEVGSAIVERANTFGMRTWGLRKERSFHPFCKKTFPQEALHSLLPTTDIVVLALPPTTTPTLTFGHEEFALMKPDSIFITLGSTSTVDETALAKAAHSGKFRGILLDTFNAPLTRNSPLWNLPNTILTPQAARSPPSPEHAAFRTFRQNLRLFVPGKLNEMHHLIR